MAKQIDESGNVINERSLEYLKAIIVNSFVGSPFSNVWVRSAVVGGIAGSDDYDGIYLYTAQVPEQDKTPNSEFEVLITGFDVNLTQQVSSNAKVHIASCPSSACPIR